jgi:tRNA modification GTPase
MDRTAVGSEPTDTIAALATAPGKAAVAVIRISGQGSREALGALGVRAGPPRRACLRTLRDSNGQVLDRGLVIWFPGPHSYCGEDSAELHLHGGSFVVESVLGALVTAGVRLAEPGEFSRRAFANGKMDLAQAEGVADLVDAESEAQARQALEQISGALGARYARWRDLLIEALAQVEALVDFPEDDVGDALAGLDVLLSGLADDFDTAIRDGRRGESVRDGYRVAIVGPPNAGKSSLFNRLVMREAAIVADLPGTTRDIIEAGLRVGGYRVVLADTAGLRAAESVVEAEGVRRARAWAEEAARRIWVLDGASVEKGWRQDLSLWRPGDLCVINKADKPQGADVGVVAAEAGQRGLVVMSISTRDERAAGVRDWLDRDVAQAMAGSDFPAVTRRRHGLALSSAAAAVRRARARLAQPELAAEDLHIVVRALGSVTGAVSAEDVLERVFATFCIGK